MEYFAISRVFGFSLINQYTLNDKFDNTAKLK